MVLFTGNALLRDSGDDPGDPQAQLNATGTNVSQFNGAQNGNGIAAGSQSTVIDAPLHGTAVISGAGPVTLTVQVKVTNAKLANSEIRGGGLSLLYVPTP